MRALGPPLQSMEGRDAGIRPSIASKGECEGGCGGCGHETACFYHVPVTCD
jgi:hypothetical protein